jgi:FKBP-type peptidyl-prolyl cis-trans isomerase
MKKIFTILGLGLALGLVSCGGGEHKDAHTDTQTPPATTTQPASPTPPPAAQTGVKPPFAITDSSKVLNLEGGVKLYVLQEGTGIEPKLESNVLAHYHGRLKDGSVFDSSFERGQPAEFPLNGVIRGWQVGFVKMKPGSRFVLVIPAEMGYGPQARPKIPANSTLIFDCEFITTT